MPGNKCYHRFSYIITNIFGRLFFRISSNLSNQDDCFCFRIILKHFQQLAEVIDFLLRAVQLLLINFAVKQRHRLCGGP